LTACLFVRKPAADRCRLLGDDMPFLFTFRSGHGIYLQRVVVVARHPCVPDGLMGVTACEKSS
jgi:hypothetical protein